MTVTASPQPVVLQVKKSLGARTWVNTWYFHCPASVSGSARVTLGRDTLADPLVAFERRLYPDEITVTDVYIGDASEQPPPVEGGTTSYYTRKTYNLPGLRATSGDVTATIAPLSICGMLHLNTTLQRPGFKFIRGMLFEGSIMPGGRKGVTFESGAAEPAATDAAVVQPALTASGLAPYLEGGTSNGVAILATPKFYIPTGTVNRSILQMTYVASINFAGVTVRSMEWRGKRRGRRVV